MFIFIPAAKFIFFASLTFLSACCFVMRRLAKGKHARTRKKLCRDANGWNHLMDGKYLYELK